MPTEIIRLTDPLTGDVCIRMLHESGLEIRVAEMPDFSTSYAQFGTKFGGVHTHVRHGGKEIRLPAGTAHFLEHKLFENAGGDVMKIFSRLGVSDNAYTMFDRTVYLFHTQRHFPEALETLLDFVQHPYFTEESIRRERGIIGQEIGECLDSPDDRLFRQLTEGLYHRHPVRQDVLGTYESIAQITPALLYQCHEMFYNLHNMVLCCAGNVTAEAVLKAADKMLQPAKPFRTEILLPDEPETPAKVYTQQQMPIGRTQFAIGFKSRPVSGMQRHKDAMLAMITIDLVAGSASRLSHRLLAEGLLSDTLELDETVGDSWFTVTAEGESDDPQAVLDALLAEIERILTEGADETLFAVLKRVMYGDMMIGMNAPEEMCDALLGSFMAGSESPFDRPQILAELTAADVLACLLERFRPENVSLAVITPIS